MEGPYQISDQLDLTVGVEEQMMIGSLQGGKL
ncbi:MAG: hypothetical protein CM1200mP12_05740 [Gammaproteobacteria bacterium]|nr:MAG: hypothetical protein CM1200mP12_05740 [Gammaproteobacteria bacterium]